MTEPEAMVFVIGDDAQMRESLKNLIGSVGLRVQAFASAQEFLKSKRPDVPGCLVLDVRMPRHEWTRSAASDRYGQLANPDHLHYIARRCSS